MEKLLLRLFVIAWFIMPFTVHAEIARHLDEELDRGRLVVESSPAGEAAQNQIRSLKEAIARGETASKQLREEIQRLEKIQAMLTSGLIGAVVTAIVALSPCNMQSKGYVNFAHYCER